MRNSPLHWYVDRKSLERGLALFAAGNASVDRVATAGPLTRVDGTCLGSQGDTYSVTFTVEISTWGPLREFQSLCSCPVRDQCKHAVALFHVYDEQRKQDAMDQRHAQIWRTLLMDCFPAVAEQSSTLGSDKGPAGTLLISFDKPSQSSRPELTIFPARPAKRPTPHKPFAYGDITFTRILNRTAFPLRPSHAKAMEQIADELADTYYRQDKYSPSPYATTAAMWKAIEIACSVDIKILDANDFRPVVINADPLPLPQTTIVADDRDWLTVSATLAHVEDARDVLAIGSPIDSAAWRDEKGVLHLSKLGESPTAGWDSLYRSDGIRIPPQDRAEFEDDFLPEIAAATRWASPDTSVSLDPPAPPQLAALVTKHVDTDTHIDVRFAFRYTRGSRVTDVPFNGPSPFRHRDTQAEEELVRMAPVDLQDRSLSGLSALEFLNVELPRLEAAGVIVSLDSASQDLRQWREAEHLSVRLDADNGSNDWFSLDVTVAVDGEEASMAALIAALNSPDRLLFTDAGTYISVDDPQFDDLVALLEEAKGLGDPRRKSVHVPAARSNWWDELEALDVVSFTPNEFLSKALAAARMDMGVIDVPAGLNATLRPYQEDGFRWLTALSRRGMGGVLADDMGLGKTLQVLAMILDSRTAILTSPDVTRPDTASPDTSDPWLVVAPTSVAPNWVTEAAKFAPDLRVILIDATSKRRSEPLSATTAHADIVVTSYALLRLDSDEYADLPLAGVILDEAQNVKNPTSKAFQAVRNLNASRVYAVTGTPIENSLTDAWSMFALANPGLLGSLKQFKEYYERPIANGTTELMDALRHRTAPFLLRRRKADVALDLPPIQHQVIRVELEPAHRKVYDLRLARERQRVLKLLEQDPESNKIEVLAALTALRQLAIDPQLAAASSADNANSPTTAPTTAPATSSKLEALIPMLHDIVAEGHRVLIFSQFTTYLRKVRTRLEQEGFESSYLDGTTVGRASVIANFKEGTNPIFLISLKAGGVGLNLTEADYVFLLDPWWNPAAEAQAIDRTHRIGQTMPVTVYRLVSADTIEDKVLALQDKKRELMDAYLSPDADSSGTGGIPLTADALDELLQ